MALEPFIDSEPFTFGVELEIQVVNTHDYDLTRAASDLMRLIKDEEIPGNITPEITESMIELSTGICTTHEQAVTDLRKIRDTLVAAADQLNVGLAGGGTHAFQQWSDRQIYDAPRFQYISELYGFWPSNSRCLASTCISAVRIRIARCSCCIRCRAIFRTS